jgi:peptide-methionine (S)-S-oxide reductase
MTSSSHRVPVRGMFSSLGLAIGVAAIGLAASAAWVLSASQLSAETARAIPAPSLDATRSSELTSDAVVLAGGCFWGSPGRVSACQRRHQRGFGLCRRRGEDGALQHRWQGMTGHAESVEVTFDPRQISLGHILQVYFSVAHDPAQLNRQGPDIGTQYRSAVFPKDSEQAKFSGAYIGQLNQTRVFPAAIVTKIESDRKFYAAEDYHQDFLVKNPTHPYIVVHDLPKIEELKRLFPDLYRKEPVLVARVGQSN